METTTGATSPRKRLVQELPVTERRVDAGGIPTALLEGGKGPPLLLLHGPGEFGEKWLRVIPELAQRYRVAAPDLPGHGRSETPPDGGLDEERVLAWLGDLIEACCAAPPTVVGHVLGGAIAARFGARHGGRIKQLVLVDSLGLAPFRPTPRFALTMVHFMVQPNEGTYNRFMRQCSWDLDALRDELGDLWPAFVAYQLERVRDPEQKNALRALMKNVGIPVIPSEELERIAVPTALIWGRHDRANRLRVAEAASHRFGWPLRVIEKCADDPPRDRPREFLAALGEVLDGENESWN